ncbi:MAG: hypothetical protein ACYTG0_40785 [Planctomycetota bacterium]|jgi:hypothetical protein
MVDYFALDPLLIGGAAVGCSLVGFVFGWLARRFMTAHRDA